MHSTRRLIVNLLPAALMAIGLSGCAGWDTIKQATVRNKAPDVGPVREDRKTALAKDFDQQRNDAQYEAALSCWQRSDIKTCNQLLTSLLDRNPNDRRARLLLADVYRSMVNWTSRPKNTAKPSLPIRKMPPRSISSLKCSTLWGVGARRFRTTKKATHLEPDNELYALSYKQAYRPGFARR